MEISAALISPRSREHDFLKRVIGPRKVVKGESSAERRWGSEDSDLSYKEGCGSSQGPTEAGNPGFASSPAAAVTLSPAASAARVKEGK